MKMITKIEVIDGHEITPNMYEKEYASVQKVISEKQYGDNQII